MAAKGRSKEPAEPASAQWRVRAVTGADGLEAELNASHAAGFTAQDWYELEPGDAWQGAAALRFLVYSWRATDDEDSGTDG